MRTILKSEFAKMRGVTPGRVSQWLKKGVISAEPDGRIDPEKARAELDRNLDQGRRLDWEATFQKGRSSDSNVIGEEADDLRNEKLKYQRARTKREELRAAQEAGALLSKEEAMGCLIAHISMAKNGFMNFSRRLAPVVTPLTDEKETELVLRREIWAILRQFADSKIIYRHQLENLRRRGKK